MPGALPERILVHTATPLSYAEGTTAWVEGEPGTAAEPSNGVAFACVLFLPAPGGTEQNAYRSRVVTVPTLLFNPTRQDGTTIVISNEDSLMIDAPELAPYTGGNPLRWLVDGEPQPFGPPGEVVGVQATLQQVRD